MQGLARITDLFEGTCTNHIIRRDIKGKIIAGSSDIFINGLAVARKGDQGEADCGHIGIITSCSPTINSNGIGVARIGDLIEGEGISAVITTCSSDVISG